MPNVPILRISQMKTPRLLRPAVECLIVEHCNLACVGCDHASDLLPERFVSAATVQADLEALSTVAHFRELRILGGEPLLHPELVTILEIARQSGVADELVLITNGTRLRTASPEVWDKTDGVWISQYPGVRVPSLPEIQEIADRHDVWLWMKDTPQFVQLYRTAQRSNSRLTEFIYRRCLLTHVLSCHVVYEGRYYKCPPSVFMRRRATLLRRDPQGLAEEDSISLHGDDALLDTLQRFVSSQTPLDACSFCLGTMGRMTPHQLSRGGSNRGQQDASDDGQSWRSDFIVPDSLRAKKDRTTP